MSPMTTVIVQWDPSAPEAPEWVYVAVAHPYRNPRFVGVAGVDDPVARRALAQAVTTADGWRELHLAPTRTDLLAHEPQWRVRWESRAADRAHLIIVDGAEEMLTGSIQLAMTNELVRDAESAATGWHELPLARVHTQHL